MPDRGGRPSALLILQQGRGRVIHSGPVGTNVLAPCLVSDTTSAGVPADFPEGQSLGIPHSPSWPRACGARVFLWCLVEWRGYSLNLFTLLCFLLPTFLDKKSRLHWNFFLGSLWHFQVAGFFSVKSWMYKTKRKYRGHV